jgi:hypothetical protein
MLKPNNQNIKIAKLQQTFQFFNKLRKGTNNLYNPKVFDKKKHKDSINP